MMRDRRVQTLAENQVLIMRALFDLLMHVRPGESTSPEHFRKLAAELAHRKDDLQELIEDGYFQAEVKL